MRGQKTFYGARCSEPLQRPEDHDSGGDKPLPYETISPNRLRVGIYPSEDLQNTFVGEGFIPSPKSVTYLSNDPRTHRAYDLLEPILELLSER